jgi:hypothetical protein
VKGGKGDRIDMDEQPFKAKLEKIPTLKPAFREGRHGDGGQLQLDLRRCGGAGADAPLEAERAA